MERMETRTARIGVIGLGYVGLPLSLLLSEAGFKVTGFDIDAKKVTDLEAGRSYIFRIPSTEIQSAREQGFKATADFSGLSGQDAIIMCVPTPLTEHREPDLSYVANTAKAAAPWLREGQLVVLESTTYPGTTEELMIPILEEGNKLGLKVQGPARQRSMECFTWPFRRSAKIRAIRRLRAAIYRRSSAAMKRLRRSLRRCCMRASLRGRFACRRRAWRR